MICVSMERDSLSQMKRDGSSKSILGNEAVLFFLYSLTTAVAIHTSYPKINAKKKKC